MVVVDDVLLGVDPVGVAARHGGEPDLSCLAPAVASVAGAPGVRAVTVDATVWAEAGASDAWEVALSLATGVAYLRALEADGVALDDALAAVAPGGTLQVLPTYTAMHQIRADLVARGAAGDFWKAG